jgi:hypothetical protein
VRVADVALRAVGFLVALAGAFLVAVYGVFLTPFRIGTTLVPISLVIAIVGNIVVIWFAYVVTRNRVLAIIPGAVWLVLSFLASSRTAAGDLLLISSDWVASLYLVCGPIAIAFCAYRLFLRR